MILHPSFRSLKRFADGDPAAARTRVARHLERCAECRRTVSEIRETRDLLRGATAPAPAAGAWEAIAARVSAGEQVILPATEPAAARRLPRGVVRAAAVAALLLAGGAAAVLSTREAAAENSELHLSPEQPGAGATVRVAYRPGSLLADAERLVLRARLVDDYGDPSWETAPVVVAQLRRDGGTYTGSFTLPDSIVYAVFAVEEPGGARVDHNGEQWELVVHDAQGRPLPRALARKAEDLTMRDTQLSAEAARRLTELYPDRVDGWQLLYYAQVETASRAQADTLQRTHEARVRLLSETMGRRGGLQVDEVAAMVFYASAVGDTATERAWKERLYAGWPRDPAVYQQRAFEVMAGDRAAVLPALERLWAESGGASGQLAFTAAQLALQARDGEALLRWGDRLSAFNPALVTFVARSAMGLPAIRPQAMDRVRAALRWLEQTSDARRPLTLTADEQRRDTDRARGFFLAPLGRALVEAGRTQAGMDTLHLAMAVTWDPRLFRDIAGARLALGDTAGAMELMARVAADPATPPAYADSARTRLGRFHAADAWDRQVQAARGEMRATVMQRAINRGVRGAVTLTDSAGREMQLDPAHTGLTVVAFWSRWCPPSRQQLGELERTAGVLRERGVRVVTIANDAPGEDLRKFVTENGLTFPIYFDTDRAARRSFQNEGTPTYMVLDASGRIRFNNHGLEDVLRQVEVLRAAR